jgi:acetyl esterase/lipase
MLVPSILLSLLVSIACAQDVPDFRDVSYAADSLTGHRLDIYLPESGEAPYPVVVVIAGSAFFGNDTKVRAYQTMGAALRKAGYAVVAINHRSSREAIFPAQIHDVKAAIRFIRANAEKYGLDAARIGITGDSSGGHLSSMAGLTGGVERAESSGTRWVRTRSRWRARSAATQTSTAASRRWSRGTGRRASAR